MPASRPAMASMMDPAPVRRFAQAEAAIQAISDYEAALCESAAWRRLNGFTVTDQDQPEEAFCLFPAHPVEPPLALVGGMGPLAGARAFRQACTRFHESRALVLYQACSVPDRSTVILGESGPDSPLCRGVALRLADAVRKAVSLAGPADQPASCIIACNSAHYFWRLLEDELRQTAPERQCNARMISLVECSLEALKPQLCRNALVLATEGARVGRIFSTPFRDAGLAFEEPSPTLGRLLMRLIFEGLKSFDEGRAVELGNQFFEAILRTGRVYDCILSGCTEVQLTIDLLRLRGSPAVAAFLSRVRVVDPLEEAFRRA